MTEKIELGIYHYKMIFSIEEKIYRIKDENHLFLALADDIHKHLNAQTGIIFKVDRQKAIPVCSFGIDKNLLNSLDFSCEKGFLSWACEYKIPLKSNDVSSDKRLSAINDPIVGTGIKISSILVIPIFFENELLGAIELINSKTTFTPQDIYSVETVARHLSVNMKNRSLMKEISGKCDYLSRIVNTLNSGLIAADKEDNLILINPKAMELLSLGNKKPHNLKELPEEFSKKIKDLLEEGKTLSRQELQFKNDFFGYSCVAVKDEKNTVSGLIFLFQNITAYKQKAG